MKKYSLFFISILILSLLCSTSYAGTLPAPIGNKYSITTPEELVALSQAVSNGDDFSGKVIVLANDIDLKNMEWTPIGCKPKAKFSGTFDGQGHKITNLKIYRFDTGNDDWRALFGLINKATIRNLHVEGNIEGDGEDGYITICAILVVDASESKIENCSVYGTVNGKSGAMAAGVCASANNSTFINCTNNANISGSACCWLGGILADSTSNNIKGCTNNGRIVFNDHPNFHPAYYNSPAGGIIAMSHGTNITGCVNNAEISCKNTHFVAGIVGLFSDYQTLITKCSNNGDILGFNGVGGIVGLIEDGAEVTDCKNFGNIKTNYDPAKTYCPHYDQNKNKIYKGDVIGLNKNDPKVYDEFKWDFHI